jgi:hypothetical protein
MSGLEVVSIGQPDTILSQLSLTDAVREHENSKLENHGNSPLRGMDENAKELVEWVEMRE